MNLFKKQPAAGLNDDPVVATEKLPVAAKKSKRKAPTNLSTGNPYLDARAEWLERYGDYIAQAKNWRIMAIVSGVVALIAVSGLAVSASQSKIVPYVVEVDKHGSAVAVGPADKAAPADKKIVRAYLSRFISDFRTLTSDPVQQRDAIDRVYSMLPQGSAAVTKISEYYKANSPFEAAQTKTVQIEITNALQITDMTWQIEWKETTRNQQGTVVGMPMSYKASIQFALNPPTDERQAIVNPVGIYVPDLNWSQVL